MRITPFCLLLSALSVLLAPVASAKNVDLSTVPDRDSVQLTIYNSEDLTLVRETRKISFKPGVNPLQFSWANTLIDPTSVELRFLTSADQLDVLDTTFPHDKPQMLYWNVQSEMNGEALVEITYFTSGISWAADYLGICNAEESSMHLESFVRVTNNSGEDYDEAQVRLVVGTINLTEKIAQLAQIPVAQVEELSKEQRRELRFKAVRSLALPAGAMGGGADESADFAAPKEIIKEGLSEYFLYTVAGTESIPSGWSKRMRSFEKAAVPMKTRYRFRPAEYGDQLVRLYLMTNDEESTLGETPLPDGTVRLFRDNGRDGLSFVAAQNIRYIPIGDKIELNLGPDPEVICEWVKLKSWRSQVWMQINGADVFRRVDDNRVEIDVNSTVAGWDDHTLFTQRIRNYSSRPIEVEFRRPLPGHIVFRSPFAATTYDYQTVEYQAQVPAGEKADLRCEVIQHQGRNAKQNNVTLEPVEQL